MLIVFSLRFVCLSDCVSLCVYPSVNEMQIEFWHRSGKCKSIRYWKFQFNFTSLGIHGTTIFSICFVCLSVCGSLCVWTECKSNCNTNFDVVFLERFLVTLGQRSRSRWYQFHFPFLLHLFTPPWYHDKVLLSFQYVCAGVGVCVCVCV